MNLFAKTIVVYFKSYDQIYHNFWGTLLKDLKHDFTYPWFLSNFAKVLDEVSEGLPIHLPLSIDEYKERRLHGPSCPGYFLQPPLQNNFDVNHFTQPIKYTKVEHPIETCSMIHYNNGPI